MKQLTHILLPAALSFVLTPSWARADDEKVPDTPPVAIVSLAPLVSDTAAKTDTVAKSEGAEQKGQIAEGKSPQRSLFPLKFGMDNYLGVSTQSGFRRTSDGIWAGNSPAYPSVGFMRWDNGAGAAAKIAVGMGRMTNGSAAVVDQPVEAWWQVPAGKSSLTIGKFWVPFAAQEWQYETKPGLMLQWSEGPNSLAVSSNYNTRVHAVNSYMRVGRSLGNEAGVGLSLGVGNGLSFNSVHDKAWGLDATFALGGFRFFGEYFGAMRHSSDAFGFLYGKIQYEKMGLWKPFASIFQWNDRSGSFGRFRSSVYGMSYQVTPMLALESAIAPTSDRRVSWVQLHWAWER